MAVINPTHRQAILHKCQAETGIDVDFDSLLGDLSSAIQDLESIAAVSAMYLLCWPLLSTGRAMHKKHSCSNAGHARNSFLVGWFGVVEHVLHPCVRLHVLVTG